MYYVIVTLLKRMLRIRSEVCFVKKEFLWEQRPFDMCSRCSPLKKMAIIIHKLKNDIRILTGSILFRIATSTDRAKPVYLPYYIILLLYISLKVRA